MTGSPTVAWAWAHNSTFGLVLSLPKVPLATFAGTAVAARNETEN